MTESAVVTESAPDILTNPVALAELFISARDNFPQFAALVATTDAGSPMQPDCDFHLELVDNLCKLESGEIRRLLMTVPPRHGKSQWASILYPAWYLGRNPTKRVMIVSNSTSVATDFSMAVRSVVQSQTFKAIFPGVKPDESRKWTQSSWYLERPGSSHSDSSMMAIGTFGSCLGKGIDMIILDDVCDQENTATEAQRDKLARWLRQTVMSRLAPRGSIIAIGHRWHIDDFYAALSEQGWPHIHYPAINSDGKALWPNAWPVAALRDQEAAIGKAIFRATYQGDPVELSEGSLISRAMMTYDKAPGVPTHGDIGIAVDCAMSEKKSADFFVIAIGYRDHLGRLVSPKMIRGKFSFAKQVELLEQLIKELRPYVVGIEGNAGGKQLIDLLKKSRPNCWIKELKPIADKVTRAAQLITLFETESVILSESHYKIHEDEIVAFPLAKHDDIVDALAWLTHLPLIECPEDGAPRPTGPQFYGTGDRIAGLPSDYDPNNFDKGNSVADRINYALRRIGVLN